MTYMKLKLLIVEDDKVLGRLIRDYFTRKGWEAVTATDGEQAIEIFEVDSFQLVLLDVMLPKQDGFTVCRKIREQSDLPIFFITARVIEEDELHGYALGADDYITKPFSFPVLYAKAGSMMNRLRGHKSFQTLKKGDIEVDFTTGKVTIAGEECHLPKLEYEMLLYFLENTNRILTREQLMVRFWGYDFDGETRTVDVHIRHLRQKLTDSGADTDYIETIRGRGYKVK